MLLEFEIFPGDANKHPSSGQRTERSQIPELAEERAAHHIYAGLQGGKAWAQDLSLVRFACPAEPVESLASIRRLSELTRLAGPIQLTRRFVR